MVEKLAIGAFLVAIAGGAVLMLLSIANGNIDRAAKSFRQAGHRDN